VAITGSRANEPRRAPQCPAGFLDARRPCVNGRVFTEHAGPGFSFKRLEVTESP